MERNTYLAHRLREVLLHGQWIAHTNCKAIIQSISWEQATQRVGDLNTLALLTYHLNYYLAGLRKVLQGGPLEIRDTYSFDLPEIQSEADWQGLVETFLENAETFAQAVEEMSDEQFDQAFVDEKYGTYLRNIEGVIEHSYYHLGQMSLLKKMVMESKG